MRCRHLDRSAGPRVPALYGTFPTEVCWTCMRWRLKVGRNWRRKHFRHPADFLRAYKDDES